MTTETWTDPETGEVLPVEEDDRPLDLKLNASAGLTAAELDDDMSWLFRLLLESVPAEDRSEVLLFVRALAERMTYRAVRSLPAASGADIEAALKTGQRMGVEAGAKVGYAKGVQDGRAAQAAKPVGAPTLILDRDEKGLPSAITEEHSDGSIVRKRIDRDADGRILRIVPATG